MESALLWIRQNLLQAGLLGIGVFMIGIGGWQWLGEASKGDEVQVISENETNNQRKDETAQPYIVDVAGAVKQPGVYQLVPGSRVGEALEKAGGFKEQADTVAIARLINLAEPVKDGQKIFIPAKNEKEGESEGNDGASSRGETLGIETIHINTASQEELETLWGVGESRAKDIIAKRPYSSIEELKTKAGIPANVLEKNEGILSVY